MPDTLPPVPSEAVERVLAVLDELNQDGSITYAVYLRLHDAVVAFPFLPQHVSPSDLIDAMVREIDAEAESYRAVAANSDDGESLTVASGSDFADVIAHRIYRLIATSRTVEQVRRETREQVAREIEAISDLRVVRGEGGGTEAWVAVRLADLGEIPARIARAAEAVDR